MRRTRAMAALAVDTRWQYCTIYGMRGEITVRGRRNLRIRVMAEHALICNRPSRQRVRIVETWIHPPMASIFGVPSERQFDQRSVLFTMQIGPCMISRTHDVIDCQFFNVLRFTVETSLPAALIVPAVMLSQLVVGAGRR